MDYSYQALSVGFFLIPGFVATAILRGVYFHKEQDSFQRTIDALIFTFVIYGITVVVTGESPVVLTETKIGDSTTYSLTYRNAPIVWIAVLAVLLPLVWAFTLNNDLLTRILRHWNITSVTSRQNVWLDVFATENRYVTVNLSDGRRLYGWPMRWSNSPEDGYVYLYDPAWVGEDGTLTNLDIHGILIAKKGNIDFIEFTKLDFKSAKEKGSS